MAGTCDSDEEQNLLDYVPECAGKSDVLARRVN